MEKMERLASDIARDMNLRGLKPWHVDDEIRLRAVPQMYKERITEMVKKKLSRMVAN